MDDIVERLRKCDADPGVAGQESYDGPLFAQAADEIERLKDALKAAYEYIDHATGALPIIRAALSQKEGE